MDISTQASFDLAHFDAKFDYIRSNFHGFLARFEQTVVVATDFNFASSFS